MFKQGRMGFATLNFTVDQFCETGFGDERMNDTAKFVCDDYSLQNL